MIVKLFDVELVFCGLNENSVKVLGYDIKIVFIKDKDYLGYYFNLILLVLKLIVNK